MTNGWTGGQYSLLRALLGSVLLGWFVAGLPATPDGTVWLHVCGALLAVLFAAGCCADRLLAIMLAALLLAGARHSGQLAAPMVTASTILLFLHLWLPPAPYGSWRARGRADAAGNWAMSPRVFQLAWSGWVAGYAAWSIRCSYLALTEDRIGAFVAGILVVVLLSIAVMPSCRRFLWLVGLSGQVVLAVLYGNFEWRCALLLLHLPTFDPNWLQPPRAYQQTRVFYDGVCGLCHASVRFILAEDPGHRFRFAPLQSAAFAEALPADAREQLPDTMVVVTADGETLIYSSGVVHILQRLGGYWRLLGLLLAIVPRPLRDAAYRFIAAVRHRLFRQPTTSCPLIPPRLRDRFMAT